MAPPYSYSSEDNNSNKDYLREVLLCKCPGCRKAFKDLKAHMLTHQNERCEKCPIQACGYHTRGFAAETSFSRVDIFKRHLISVHAVEPTRTHSHKRSSGDNDSNMKPAGYGLDAAGKCSTCSCAFSNSQGFYELILW